MNRCDVIVVGAGPGGASAAHFLAAGGAQVLVAEQAWLPRYKPCGGAVPRAALDQFPCDFGDVVECRPREVIYCWQGGQSVTQDLTGRPLAMVMRERFDAQILNSTPADVRDGTPIRSAEENVNGVRVFTEAGDAIHADYLVVADGATSRLARTLGLRRRRLLTVAIEAEVDPEATIWEQYAGKALFDFGVLPFGYLWVFAKREHLSVGIACFRGKQPAMRQTLISEMARLGVDLSGVRLHGHTLPLYRGPERRGTERSLLVGDAAGLVDSFSGEGVRHAIASGRIAAQAILEGQAGTYSRRIERYARVALRPTRTVSEIFYRIPRLCFQYGMQNPRSTRLLADWLNGNAGKARVMTGLLLSMIEGAMKLT